MLFTGAQRSVFLLNMHRTSRVRSLQIDTRLMPNALSMQITQRVINMRLLFVLAAKTVLSFLNVLHSAAAQHVDSADSSLNSLAACMASDAQVRPHRLGSRLWAAARVADATHTRRAPHTPRAAHAHMIDIAMHT